ncbi:hypothetical protein KSNIM_01095, partial [Kitasatospora sp. DSM 101779]
MSAAVMVAKAAKWSASAFVAAVEPAQAAEPGDGPCGSGMERQAPQVGGVPSRAPRSARVARAGRA